MKKNLLLIIFMMAITFVSSNLRAQDDAECRSVIGIASQITGADLNANEISTATFTDLNLSVEDLNSLNSTEQEAIYNKIKPLKDFADELTEELKGISLDLYRYYMMTENEEVLKQAIQVAQFAEILEAKCASVTK